MTDKTKEQTETTVIEKSDTTVPVDSMATVVTDLIKTKDILIEKQETEKQELLKKIEGLEKEANENPVDKGTEEKATLKVVDADDVGVKADAKNDVAPKPSEAQASIIPPAVKEPGTDSAGLSMENKSDEKKDEKKEEVKKEDKEEKKDEKKEEMKKSLNSVYKVVETVRPAIFNKAISNEVEPTAYQMLKALEQGFGVTKKAEDALVIMHQKMDAGEFGTGRGSGGVF